MLICSSIIKFSERDNWENGCVGPSQCYSIEPDHLPFYRESAIRYAMDFTGEVNQDNVELNACDELGRIDIQVQENECGERLTAQEWEQFKAGEIDTYAVTYSFYFKQVTEFSF